MSASQKSNIVKWNDLKGRAVVDIAGAKRVGTVDDLVLDPQTRQIIGLKFKPGLFNADQTVPVSVINGIGEDAVTLRLEGISADPQEAQSFKAMPTLTQVISNGVVTQSGKFVGAVNNVDLTLQPLAIIGYEISEGGLFSKKHTFQVTPQVNYGEKLITIPDSLLDAANPVS